MADPYHDKLGRFTTGPSGDLTGPGGKIKRYGQMSNRERAHLTAHAQIKSKISAHTKKVIGSEPRKIPQGMFQPHLPEPHAVALQTSKALEKDFHQARDKKAHAEMRDAIERHQAKKMQGSK